MRSRVFLSLFPKNLPRLWESPSVLRLQGMDSVCSFVRSRENQLMNLGLSPRLHNWKPVTTHTHLSSFATELFPEAWLRQGVISAVHIHSGQDGKPWGMIFLMAKKSLLPLTRIIFLSTIQPVIMREIKSTFQISVVFILPCSLLPPWSLKEQKM